MFYFFAEKPFQVLTLYYLCEKINVKKILWITNNYNKEEEEVLLVGFSCIHSQVLVDALIGGWNS